MGNMGRSSGFKTLFLIFATSLFSSAVLAQVGTQKTGIVLGAEAATGTTVPKTPESSSSAPTIPSLPMPNRMNKNSMMYSGGDCSSSPNPAMISQFEGCKGSGPTNASTKNSFVVDADNKVGYILDPSGRVLKCVPITVGSASSGNPATLGRNEKQTRQGMFYAQTHSGEKYQTNNPDPALDAIGFGDSSGRVIHSSHGNNTTIGCIGIAGIPDTAANADANFLAIKRLLGTDGGAIFVYGSNYSGCGDNGDTYNGMGSRLQKQLNSAPASFRGIQ